MTTGFPRSIFAMTGEIIRKAVPIMKAYKRRDIKLYPPPSFDREAFDREKPWFVRLWGEVEPGQGGDQIEMAASMSGESMVELLAFVGPTDEGYPMLMTKAQFEREYELD